MEVKYHGGSCVSITEGKNVVVADPHAKAKLSGNIVTVSTDNDGHNAVDSVEGEKQIFSWPGEYESGGIHVRGIHSADASGKENIIYTYTVNGTHFCHLGNLGTKLDEEQSEKIGDIDILFVPADGKSLDPKTAKSVIEEIEPRVIIPVTGEGSPAAFLKEIGGKAEEEESFKVTKAAMPDDATRIIMLSEQ